MKNSTVMFVAAALILMGPGMGAAGEAEDGFISLFNGKTLDGWDGDPSLWSVRDDAITARTTPETKLKKNSFLIFRKFALDDFELRLSYKIVGGNSGIQYRSKVYPDWSVGGYQADFEAGDRFSGILYEERGRGILANRGQRTRIGIDGKKQSLGNLGDSAAIQKKIKKEDWNDYTIIAQGNHLIHKINGVTTVEVIDDQKWSRAFSGYLALQVHVGPPMTVQFKNIRVKRLLPQGKKKIILVAGRQSHGEAQHEHNAGVLLFAKCLSEFPGILARCYLNGNWPGEEELMGAAAIVVYSDGNGSQPLHHHLEEVDRLAKRGLGIGCIHYAVEVPKGKAGNYFLDWIGGYFETNWSVNPHWLMKDPILAEDHPITRGVSSFEMQDEWYFHMRFREGMKGVTPILSAVPPPETMKRPDGAHSGNPHVRKAVAAKIPQHLVWACQRNDGGRGFGFTGGHFHKEWANDDMRKIILNAILWVARVEVPEMGYESTVTDDDLKMNLDYKGRRRRR